MLPQNKPDRIRILFDDHRLVANAGLLLPATLARHLGLRELVDHHLDLGGAPGRANTGDKMLTLVASALAGGDCIDDADALRDGGTVGVLGCSRRHCYPTVSIGQATTGCPDMPADRRITVNLSAEGTRNQQGEYVPGAVTPIEMWATRRDVGQELKIERQGTRDETSRDWRIRWDSRIASSPTSLLKVEDGGGGIRGRLSPSPTWLKSRSNGGGQDIRRRFIDLQGIHG